MPFHHPPQGLSSSADAGGVTLTIHPWLPDDGRRDLGRAVATVAVAYAVYRIGMFLGFDAGMYGAVLALVILAIGSAVLGRDAIRRARALRAQLELRVGRDEVRLVLTTDGRVQRDERVFLRNIGRVDVREAGYQRPHVVASLAGGALLVIPMERHPEEAAQWVARELAAGARTARERDGAGEAEIPEALRKLSERRTDPIRS